MRDIAQRQQIPLPYLKRLIAPLVSASILRGTRGTKGGLRLLKSPKDIKLKEVIQLLEGRLAPVECVDDPGICERSSYCATRDLWVEMQRAMEEVLEATTLKDLMERQREKERPITKI